MCVCVCVGFSLDQGLQAAWLQSSYMWQVNDYLRSPLWLAEQRHTLTAPKTAGAVARRSYSGCLATEASLFQSCLRTFSVVVSTIPTVIPCRLHKLLQLHFILWNHGDGQFCGPSLSLNRQTVPGWAQLAKPFFHHYFGLRQCHLTSGGKHCSHTGNCWQQSK